MSEPLDDLRNPLIALRFHCPYCDAPPGVACNSATGQVHYSRTPCPLPADDEDEDLEVPF